MNMMQLVEPMTNGYYTAKEQIRPLVPQPLSIHYKRFLWDNVYSELGEFHLAVDKLEQVDAIVDTAIYTIDVCLRNGYDAAYALFYESIDPNYKVMRFVSKVPQILKGVLYTDSTTVQMELCFEILTECENALNSLGYPLIEFVKLVANYNNSKLVDGVAILAPNGKILKPEGWVAPDRDLKALMEKYDNA